MMLRFFVLTPSVGHTKCWEIGSNPATQQGKKQSLHQFLCFPSPPTQQVTLTAVGAARQGLGGRKKNPIFSFNEKPGFSPGVRKISTSDLFKNKWSLCRFTMIFTQGGTWNFHRDPSVPVSRGEKFLDSSLGIPWDWIKAGFTSWCLILCKTKLHTTKIPPCFARN